MIQIVDKRFRAGHHIGHRVVATISLVLHLIQRRAAPLFVIVWQIVCHIQQPLEVLFVVVVLIDNEFLLAFGGSIRIDFFLDGDVFFGRGFLVRLFNLVEHRIVFHLLFDALLQGHDRQLQDFHRLDHPRCKHLLLSQSAFVDRVKVASFLEMLVSCIECVAEPKLA